MFEKELLTLFLICRVTSVHLQTSFKYNAQIQDEQIFMPCNIPDVYFIDRYLDKSNLEFEFLANSSIHVHGYSEWIKDLGTDNGSGVIKVYLCLGIQNCYFVSFL